MDYRTFFDLANVMMLVLDGQQRVVMINPKGCKLLGYPESEIVGKNWFDHFLPTHERKRVETYWNKTMKGKLKPLNTFENSIVCKGGQHRLISWNNTFLTDSKGRIRYTISSGENLTEDQSNNRLAVLACKPDGTILDANPAMIKLLGLSRAKLNSSPKIKRSIEMALKKGLEGFTLDFIRKNGQVLALKGSIFPLKVRIKILFITLSSVG